MSQAAGVIHSDNECIIFSMKGLPPEAVLTFRKFVRGVETGLIGDDELAAACDAARADDLTAYDAITARCADLEPAGERIDRSCPSWCDRDHPAFDGTGVLHAQLVDGFPLPVVRANMAGFVARTDGEIHVRVTRYDGVGGADAPLVDLNYTGAEDGLTPQEARRVAGWLIEAADIAEAGDA